MGWYSYGYSKVSDTPVTPGNEKNGRNKKKKKAKHHAAGTALLGCILLPERKQRTCVLTVVSTAEMYGMVWPRPPDKRTALQPVPARQREDYCRRRRRGSVLGTYEECWVGVRWEFGICKGGADGGEVMKSPLRHLRHALRFFLLFSSPPRSRCPGKGSGGFSIITNNTSFKIKT